MSSKENKDITTNPVNQDTTKESKPIVMSPADGLLSQIISEQSGRSLEPSRDELVRITRADYTSMFNLPEECNRGDGLNYTYSWCETDERMLRYMMNQGYQVANRTNAPFLAGRINHVCGAITVQRASLHVLMLRSKKWSEAETEATYKRTLGRMQESIDRVESVSDGTVKAVSRDELNLSSGYGMDGPASAPHSFDADGSSESL